MTSKYMQRKRIMIKMENMEKYPLTIVHAPMGYGKTVAVKEYLREEQADYVWVSLSGNGMGADDLWERLCHAMKNTDQELSERLASIGYPYDGFKRNAVMDALMDHDYRKNLLLIFDDFQFVEDANVFEILKGIVQERINRLHIVIITRELARLDAADLYQKQLCCTITEKSLKFTREETFRYLDFMDCQMTEEEKERVYQITDGWESMLYVTAKGIKQGLPIGKSATADDIIEQNFYHNLSDMEKQVLAKLCVLNSFSRLMAAEVLDDAVQYQLFEALTDKNIFFVFQESDHTFRMRNILKDYIYERALIDRIDFTDVYRKAGSFLLKEKQYAGAFEYLLKAGEVRKILQILNEDIQNEKGTWNNVDLNLIFEKTEEEICFDYPFAYIKYLMMYAMEKGHNYAAPVNGRLKRLEDHYREADDAEELKAMVSGEICMVCSRMAFNRITKMEQYAKDSAAFLDGGCSSIITRKTEFTYGLPSLLMGYVKEAGELKKTAEELACFGKCLSRVTDGFGSGCDSLAAAEAALEMGQMEQAELHAYKAYYKAKSSDQLSIMICAKLVLDRLSILQGNESEQILSNDTLREEVIAADNKILNTTYDLCDSYRKSCMGKTEGIPEWIRKGELEKGNFYAQAPGFFYVVYGKCLLLDKKYIELDSLCESIETLLRPYQYHLVRMYFLIYESVSKSYLESRTRGEQILKEALLLAEQDHLIMAFAENTGHIRLMLESLLKRGKDDYIEEILGYCNRYQLQLKRLHTSSISLTDRETDILKLLDEGYTHEEIAGEIYISVATVRYHIKNIYQKMDVNNKILALRRAKEMNLI